MTICYCFLMIEGEKKKILHVLAILMSHFFLKTFIILKKIYNLRSSFNYRLKNVQKINSSFYFPSLIRRTGVKMKCSIRNTFFNIKNNCQIIV